MKGETEFSSLQLHKTFIMIPIQKGQLSNVKMLSNVSPAQKVLVQRGPALL